MEDTASKSLIKFRCQLKTCYGLTDESIIDEYINKLKTFTTLILQNYRHVFENKIYIADKPPKNQWDLRKTLKFGINLSNNLWKDSHTFNKGTEICFDTYKYYHIEVIPSIDGISGWITMIIKFHFFNTEEEEDKTKKQINDLRKIWGNVNITSNQEFNVEDNFCFSWYVNK